MWLTGVPLPCQKQPAMKSNREHSRDVRVTAELPPRSWKTWEIQPDKDGVSRWVDGIPDWSDRTEAEAAATVGRSALPRDQPERSGHADWPAKGACGQWRPWHLRVSAEDTGRV
jgi:hypothetical protein